MRIISFSAGVLATALVAGLPPSTWADEKVDFEKAVAAAEESRKKAALVGGEWRDIGKFLKEAEALAKGGDYATAMKLVEKAKKQGELGYEQAMAQKDASFPDYMTAGSAEEPVAKAVETSSENKISADIDSVEVMHNGKKVVVIRGHDNTATLPEEFLKTDRGCPPFCVQPMTAAEGVDTVGELEVLDFLKRSAGGDTNILVVDSRTPDWVIRGTIPGAVNIPWNQVGQDSMSGMFGDSGESQIDKILEERFGAKKGKKGWDFSGAKTLILFCNGIWCGQSSSNIVTLLDLGYPAEKLKWYRGGMQDWVSAGLTTVKP
jgi:rhodanese-related sulfurtransferase